MLAGPHVLDKHPTGGASTPRRCLHTNYLLNWCITQYFHAGIFITAFVIATFVCSRALPLMKAVPAEVESPVTFLGAYWTDETLIFLAFSFTEGMAARTLLNSHSFAEIILRYFGFKIFLFIFTKNSKATDINVWPFCVAASTTGAINERAVELEFPSTKQAATVSCERVWTDGMSTWHFGSLSFRIVVPRDHVWFISQLGKFIQLLHKWRIFHVRVITYKYKQESK